MNRFLAFTLILAMSFGFFAFQCSSTELTSAKLYMQQKQYDKAKEALKKEIAKNPKSEEGHYWLGVIYGEENEFDLMIDAFDKASQSGNKFAKNISDSKTFYWASNFNKGVSYFNKASKTVAADSMKMFYDKAVEAFNSAVLCQPDSVDTYTNLAFAYVNQGDNQNAVETLDKQLELYKKRYNLSDASGKLEGEQYSKISDVYSLSGDLLTKLGASAENKDEGKKHYDAAIAKLEEARKYFPDNSDILLHLSNAYIATDRLDVAMDAFRVGVENEPENKYYRFNYGSMLLNVDKFDEASVQLSKAVEIDPEYENAIYNLAVTYVKWGANLREEAVKEEREDDETYKEKYQNALPYLEKYVEIDPENGQFWDLLFKVYTNLGMNDKAEDAFKKSEEFK